MEKVEITEEDCLIRYNKSGKLPSFPIVEGYGWYLHVMQDHPEINTEMYVVKLGKAGAKVFKEWDAKKFMDQAKHNEDLSIEYLIPRV